MALPPLTKTPAEVYAPTTAGGAPRGASMGDALLLAQEMIAGTNSEIARLEGEISAASAGIVVKATWAELAAIDGTRDGQAGRVAGTDAGTHTDPVVGGTVANEGEYSWDAGDEGWQRVGDIQDVNEALDAIADADATLSSVTLADDLIYVGTTYEVEAVDPAGEIVQGTDKATGLPLVGGGGGGGASDPTVATVLRSSGSLKILFPQAGTGKYVRYDFNHLINAGQNSDVWQIQAISAASLAGGTSTVIQQICDTGQVEVALAPTASGGSFTIGGNAHGRDEILDTPTLLIDGVAVDINGGTAAFTGKRIEIFQVSQMYDPTDLSNFAKRHTRWLFADGELDLTNHIIVEKEIEFGTMYLAMLPVVRLAGATQITHSAVRSPLFYPVEDVSGAHAPAYTTANAIKVWGDSYSAEAEILEGWSEASRESWISSSLDRNKLYFAPFGVGEPFTPSIGEILRLRSRMRVSVLNS